MKNLNLPAILFAILDSNTWDVSQLVSWTDQLIPRLEKPKFWLIKLSLITSSEDGIKVIHEVLQEFGVILPENTGDLIAGFILLQFDNAKLSEGGTRSQLVDIIDSYEGVCGIDAEAAGKLDLTDPVYSGIRTFAKQTLKYLDSERMLEIERHFLEDQLCTFVL